MTEAMQPSYRQQLIEQQLEGCRVYLHKPTGVRYYLALALGGANELHPISGRSMYATDDQLANSEVWERQA
ncbi:hypothetical protein D3C85_1792250 [compost metagenome]